MGRNSIKMAAAYMCFPDIILREFSVLSTPNYLVFTLIFPTLSASMILYSIRFLKLNLSCLNSTHPSGPDIKSSSHKFPKLPLR